MEHDANGYSVTCRAEPAEVHFDLRHTAVIMIDMQRDFLDPEGFGALLGNDVSKLRKAVEPCSKILEAARQKKLLVIHTREGHRADMSDVFPHKNRGGALIGSNGALGRVLIRGEAGHDIIPELYPKQEEPIVDKPGKGSFYATDLETILRSRNIQNLIVCGVTTEVCVNTTVREANDRGFHCLVIDDACASYIDEFHVSAMKMISAQGGIFGSVTDSASIVTALLRHD